jgi:hypothetical protein
VGGDPQELKDRFEGYLVVVLLDGVGRVLLGLGCCSLRLLGFRFRLSCL